MLGFFHPSRGYWQTAGVVPQSILDGYPKDTVEVPVKPSTDHDWDGKQWVELPPDMAAIRAQASAAMLQRIEAFTAQFTAKYPSAEIASWPTQAAEAKDVLAGGSSVVIAAFAATRGVSEAEMAERIAGKSAAYMTIISRVAGLRDATFDALELAATPEQVHAVLDGAMVKAQGMAKKMGLTF